VLESVQSRISLHEMLKLTKREQPFFFYVHTATPCALGNERSASFIFQLSAISDP
jgi:hypothetical protein